MSVSVCVLVIGATALLYPLNASPPTLDIMATKCIWSPSNICNWLPFFAVSK